MMSEQTGLLIYDLCEKDDDCERGHQHFGECGPGRPDDLDKTWAERHPTQTGEGF